MRHAYGLGEHYNTVERLKEPANAEDSWEKMNPVSLMLNYSNQGPPKYKCISKGELC